MPDISLDAFVKDLRSWPEFEGDEWHFVRLRQELANSREPWEAFALIDDVVPYLLEENERFPLQEWGYLILELARRSDTSEIPSVLKREWNRVVAKFAVDVSIVRGLSEWYRRPSG